MVTAAMSGWQDRYRWCAQQKIKGNKLHSCPEMYTDPAPRPEFYTTMGNKFIPLHYLAVVFALLLPVLAHAGDLSFRLPEQTPMEPGYATQQFPRDAVAYRSAREILRIAVGDNRKKLPDYGQLPGAPRIIGMGHSFTVPGYCYVLI
jgi:hypothetical protein